MLPGGDLKLIKKDLNNVIHVPPLVPYSTSLNLNFLFRRESTPKSLIFHHQLSFFYSNNHIKTNHGPVQGILVAAQPSCCQAWQAVWPGQAGKPPPKTKLIVIRERNNESMEGQTTPGPNTRWVALENASHVWKHCLLLALSSFAAAGVPHVDKLTAR